MTLVPDGRGAEPREPVLASGPRVRLNENNKLKTRTYADLIMTPYEKDLVTYHMTGQVAVINAKSRAVRKVGRRPIIVPWPPQALNPAAQVPPVSPPRCLG